MVYMEKLIISEHIAGNCGRDVGFSEDNCQLVLIPGKAFFSEANTNCTQFDYGNDDKVCYHKPTSDTILFGS